MGKKNKKKKENGNENRVLETIVFITAILNLIEVLVDLIKDFIRQELNTGNGGGR